MTRRTTHNLSLWVLFLLALEKIVQHATVTVALLGDWRSIRSTVVVDYRWLVITGAIIGVLYAVALAALKHDRYWSLKLLTLLALADIAGEFIAQGTLAITVTVSFIVAILILILAQSRAYAAARGRAGF